MPTVPTNLKCEGPFPSALAGRKQIDRLQPDQRQIFFPVKPRTDGLATSLQLDSRNIFPEESSRETQWMNWHRGALQ
jgi:hypothetical protein